jgi:polyribonucleotide nucleotidyltransferase
MVESEAKELTEDQMLGAVLFAHQEMQVVIKAVEELCAEVGVEQWIWEPEAANADLVSAMTEFSAENIAEAYRITEKMSRQDRLSALRDEAVAQFVQEAGPSADDVSAIFGSIEKKAVRRAIIAGEPRIDGRDTKTVRGISVEVGVLPKTHGSALFTRGETQALVTTTLGSMRDAAIIDALQGSYRDHFMLHYNFPPLQCG